MQVRPTVRGIIGASTSALFIAFVLGSFSTAGVIDMTTAWLLLLGAWLIGIVAIIASESFLGLKGKHKIVSAVGGAFVLGGILTCLGWYEYIMRPPEPVMPHARLEHTSVDFPEESPGGNRLINIHFQNHGTIYASYAMILGSYIIVDDEYTKGDQDKAMDNLKQVAIKSAPLSQTGVMIYPGQDIKLTLNPGIRPDDWWALKEGRKLLYLFSLSKFSDENTSSHDYWISEVCMKIERSFLGGAPCVNHYFIYRVKQ